MNDSSFTYAVNDRRCACNVAETIFLSPVIHPLIQTDITMQECVLQAELITSNDFWTLLNGIRGFVSSRIVSITQIIISYHVTQTLQFLLSSQIVRDVSSVC
jgi:hypothetical protein